MRKHYCIVIACVYLAILFICGLAGCDRIGGSRYAQLIQDADSKSANGDFARAINFTKPHSMIPKVFGMLKFTTNSLFFMTIN